MALTDTRVQNFVRLGGTDDAGDICNRATMDRIVEQVSVHTKQRLVSLVLASASRPTDDDATADALLLFLSQLELSLRLVRQREWPHRQIGARAQALV